MDILLMGDPKSGRSSIAKVIFQKMVSKSTKLLGETSKMETYDFKIQKIEFKLYDFPAKYDINDPPPSEQMIFRNAAALIYVLSPQSDILKAMDNFHNIYNYIKKKNTNNCSIFIFTNKADIDLTQSDARNEYLIKLKKKISEDEIDIKEIEFYFTSINDSSIFEAFSKVVQKMIPCSPNICKLLNHFANHSKIEKAYLFDLVTKLYIGHNDEKLTDQYRYDICSDILDIFIDISYLYDKDRHDGESKTTVKLNYEE
jgi:Ras-related GTP-binding protein C/D